MNFTPAQVESFEKKVAAAPGGTAFARLADHFRSQGQLDQAIALCEKGIQGNPGYPTGHLLLGRCLYEKNRTDEAKAAFASVLKLDRKNIFVLKIMGDIHVQSGKMEEAAAFYARACDADPLNPELSDLLRRHRQYLPHAAGAVIDLAPPETKSFPAAPAAERESFHAGASPEPETSMVDLSPSDEMSLAMLPDAEPPRIDLSGMLPEPALSEKPVTAAPAPAIEMVDLPPAMTGYSEARVGDFGVRKSLYERVKAEENDLVESAYGEFDRRTAYAEKILDEVPVPPTPAAPVPDFEPESPAEAPESAAPETAEPAFSSAAPGAEGFYSVSGDSAGAAEVGAGALLEGIDEVEMGAGLSEETEEVEAEEAPAQPMAAAERTPAAAEGPAGRPAPVALAEGLDAEEGLQSLVEEIVDGGFLASEALPAGAAPAAVSAAASAPAPLSAAPAPMENSAVSDFSAAAAGADGFYNVTGDSAAESSESEHLLADIDQVDLEEEIAEASSLPEASGVAVELGNEVEFEMPVMAEVTAPAPAAASVSSRTPVAGSARAETPPAAQPVPAPAPSSRLAPPTPAGETAAIKVVGHVATVSLADLYLKQGHHREALAVYKKLLVLHPGDAKITQKILTIENELKTG